MRMLGLIMVSTLLSACCSLTGPAGQQSQSAAVEKTALPSVSGEESTVALPVAVEALPVPPVEAVPSAAEGVVVCRLDGDVRIVEIHMLEDGRCMLVYDNRLSGSGTQNVLASRADCEIQQQRMKQNFLRSGFSCS